MRGSLVGITAAFLGLAWGVTDNTALAQVDWTGTVAAARKEARVVLYTNTVPSVNERLKADFEKAHPGMVLEYSRIVGPAVASKLDQERQAGSDGGDALITSELPWLDARAKDGVLKAPAGPSAKAWPKQYMLRGTVPLIGFEPFVLLYNTKLVKNPVNGYTDLLRPEFKGRLGTTDLASPAVVAWYDWLEKTQGPDYLARFAAQGPRLFVGSVPSAQAVAAGEVSAAAFSIITIAQPLIEQGAPIRIVVPKPAIANAYGATVLGWSKRANAALLFLDYLTSSRAQTLLAGRGEMASPLPNIPGSLDAKSMSPYEAARYTPEVVKAYTEKWNKLFKSR